MTRTHLMSWVQVDETAIESAIKASTSHVWQINSASNPLAFNYLFSFLNLSFGFEAMGFLSAYCTICYARPVRRRQEESAIAAHAHLKKCGCQQRIRAMEYQLFNVKYLKDLYGGASRLTNVDRPLRFGRDYRRSNVWQHHARRINFNLWWR